MPSGSLRIWLDSVARAGIGASVLLVAVFAVVWRAVGTSEGAWARLRGEAVAVVPSRVDLGACRPGEVKELQLRVINVSAAPVTLTGMYTSCSCLLSSSLPMVVEARSTATLQLTIDTEGERGAFERRAVLYTSSGATPQLPVEVVGRILGGHDEATAVLKVKVRGADASFQRRSDAEKRGALYSKVRNRRFDG